MAAIRYRNADPGPRVRVLWIAAAWLGLAGGPAAARPPLSDAAVAWHEDDRRDIPEPAERDPNLLFDGVTESLYRPLARMTHPGRFVRRVGTLFGGDHVPPAANVNDLDEVPNSSWFTNRRGFFPMTPEEVARGPATGGGPDMSAPWTVVSAKSEGVTPGFNIKDARGDVYLIKFDPPGYPGMTSGAGAITGRILHAAGYNVPEDHVVRFRREDLVLAEKVSLRLPDGTKRTMTVEDLDNILAPVDRLADGRWLAISSRFLKGKPLGPFDYKGRRPDDPNDRVNHEDRRELRGLRMFCAWLDHFDTKQHNSLDMYVQEGGRHYVRHHLIDFASTLGAGASGPWPQHNFEYAFDVPAIFGRTLALGLHEDAWRRIRRPEGLKEVGYYESLIFDPLEWKPLNPNTAFANLTDRDGYWAAKIISAFTDGDLEAVAAEGRFENPEAAAWIARVLGERRDRIARLWFDRIPPLDFFSLESGRLRYRDLGAGRNIYPGTTPRYRARAAACTPDRQAAAWSAWAESERTELDLSSGAAGSVLDGAPEDRFPFAVVECQVDRGRGYGPSVKAYVARSSGRVVAVDR